MMDGLRSFIDIDNHGAVDVGHLHRGMRPFSVQKPNFSEDCPEATLREGADELTSRAEEVKNVDSVHQSIYTTLRKTDENRRWLMRTGMPSASNLQRN